MTQTSYSRDPLVGLPGQIANARPHDISTHITEGAGIFAGLYVVAGTNEDDAAVPTAAFTTGGLGIVHYSDTIEASSDVQSYGDNEAIGVVRRGCVLVAYELDTVPTPNTPAFARHTANGAGKIVLGAIRADADTSNASAIPGGMFRQVFTSAGLAVLELSGHVAS